LANASERSYLNLGPLPAMATADVTTSFVHNNPGSVAIAFSPDGRFERVPLVKATSMLIRGIARFIQAEETLSHALLQ